MSIPTLQGLQTALSGLQAAQESLDVVGQNIANANTPGYSRQTAILQTNLPLSIAALSPVTGQGAKLGTGVGVETIQRIHSSYLEAQYRAQSSSMGAAETLAEVLGQAQSALGEPSSPGIGSQMSTFWSAWNDLASSPESIAAKEAVISAGSQLAEGIKQLNGQIEQIGTEASQRYETLTGAGGEVESYAEQVASLNGEIRTAELAGQPPNELLDRRELLIDNLAKLAKASVSEGEDGMVSVSFGGAATPLVSGTEVNWPPSLTAASGGQLGTLLELTSEEPPGQLAGYRQALNQVAETLASSVNALQPSSPFFAAAGPNPAQAIEVTATPANVAAGSAGEGSGGNSLALQISGLREGQPGALYDAFVTKVGGDVQAARRSESTAGAMLGAVAERRQSLSGVSTDEEMTQLVSFQRGYEASARVMTAMDGMLETLINHTGRVGL